MELQDLGFDEWFRDRLEESGRQRHSLARVTIASKDRYLVRNESGEVAAEPTGRLVFSAESSADLPAVGDWALVECHDQGTLAIIDALLPRKTVLRRKAAGKKVEYQMIAANIDVAFIIQSCDSDFNLRRLERYLVMAHDGGIRPALLLSKSDLVSSEELENMTSLVRGAGIDCEIIAYSSKTGQGLDEVREALRPGQTYCLLGSSGVGKTTLLNHLIGRDAFQTNVVREKDGKGRHTTARRQLVVLDPARGRREASGAVQAIPGHGEPVEPVIRDQLRNGKWPLFLHPYPLGDGDGRGSGKYFLVACQPQRGANWGLYLVDAFDNMLLLREEPGYALLEPVPLEPRPRPPVIPDKVRPGKKDAIIYLSDIYEGDGLKGIPRGTVKRLRIFSYHFSYRHMGGLLGVIGMDGPWDMRRILGTVPVEPDGSATFRVPANTPLSIQPLDGEGKALQVMRSWMTAMPGEVLSCAGCHEPQNTSPPNRDVMALSKPPADIEPWHGPERPYAFKREVQPVLDAHCVSCHDGKPRPDGQTLCDLRGEKIITDYRSVTPGTGGKRGGRFSVSYVNLHRFVRRPGIESDYHMLEPMEFHADTTQLVQMLEKGHHGVRLDAEAWDRLVTWIDLNAPYHGTWTEAGWDPKGQRQRRRELLKEYAGMDLDPEKVIPPEPYERPEAPAAKPAMATPKSKIENPEGWPFDAAEAKRRQAAAGAKAKRSIELGEGVQMDLVLVPPGEFVMGSAEGYADERPQGRVRIERPFWMGAMEVTNEQFARFDPSHDSRVEPKNTYQFGVHGYPANGPRQPVVRITWEQAMAFCRWLSERTGERVTLPTEAQWEWACRAGSADAFSFGSLEADYSKHANVADKTLREFASNPYTVSRPLKKATKYDDWIPRDDRFRDGGLIAMPAGTYAPNAWGLREMHGNVFEWTRSAYRPYPYSPDDGRNEPGAAGDRVVRGGSWRDRPVRCRAAFRLAHRRYQRVYNVGFRVIVQPVVKAVQRAAPMAGDHGSGS
jgi:ribosome small subunit-dependent GTPase A